jgi:uroporphyrinogen-III synthase
MTRILSTKKLLQNQKMHLLHAGFSVLEADFISIGHVSFSIEGIGDNLIFTSSNAVRAVASHPDVQEIRRKPCFCVGEKTAALLDESGFTVVETADSASALATIIETGYKTETFTFCCGNLRMETLPTDLKIAGVGFNEIEVYETTLNPVEIKPEVDGILFFSPSGVQSFLAKNDIGEEVCFCIGETTAAAIPGNARHVVIAGKPSVDNVIVRCVKYFGKMETAG